MDIANKFYHVKNESISSLPILQIRGLFPKKEKIKCHYIRRGAGGAVVDCSTCYVQFRAPHFKTYTDQEISGKKSIWRSGFKRLKMEGSGNNLIKENPYIKIKILEIIKNIKISRFVRNCKSVSSLWMQFWSFMSGRWGRLMFWWFSTFLLYDPGKAKIVRKGSQTWRKLLNLDEKVWAATQILADILFVLSRDNVSYNPTFA